MKKKIVFSILSSCLIMGATCFAFGSALLETKSSALADNGTKTIYLNAGGSDLWDRDGAKFGVWSWSSSISGSWSSFMTLSNDAGYYKVDINSGCNQCIFVRFKDTTTAPDWSDSKYWNKTGDLSIPSGKNCYTITGWGTSDGKWSAHEETKETVYTCTVNDGQPIEMIYHQGTEYKLPASMLFEEGDKLSFYADDEPIEVTAKASSSLSHNNVKTVEGGVEVLQTVSAATNVYFDIVSNIIWVGGYSGDVKLFFGVAGWENVYAYSYDANGTPGLFGAWPGTKIFPVSGICFEKNGNGESRGLYVANMSYGLGDVKIIFNNGSGSQTANLDIIPGGYYAEDYQTTGDTVRGEAANFIYEFGTAIAASEYEGKNSSTCGLSSGQLNSYVGQYDVLSSEAKVFADAATIWTYTNMESTAADKDFTFAEIMNELNARVSGEGDSARLPSVVNNNTTLIIVIFAIATLTICGIAIYQKRKAYRASK